MKNLISALWLDMALFVLIAILAIVFAAGTSGCSAKQQISDAAVHVRKNQAAIRDDAGNLRIITDAQLSGTGKAAASELLDDIDAKAVDTSNVADFVQKKLNDVEDKNRIWNTIKLALWAMLAVAVAFLIWRFDGIFKAVYRVVDRLIQRAVDGVAHLIGH